MTPRVLVLDDDVLMCELLDRMLVGQGFSVATETAACDALDRLAKEDFDVVLSDVNMAVLDGLAFTQRVIASKLEVPVILITGAASMELAMSAVLAGAWDFLLKPLDERMLWVSMDRAVKHRQLKRDLHALRTEIDRADLTLYGS